MGLVEYGRKKPFGLGVGAAAAAGAEAILVADDRFGEDKDDFGVDVKGWCTPNGEVNWLLDPIGDPK